MAGDRFFVRLSETQLANQNDKPRYHSRQHAGAIDVNKHALRIRDDVVQARANQQNHNRHRYARHRYTHAGDFTHHRRQLFVLRERVKHTPAAVHPAVTAGERRRQHHKVDNGGRRRDANLSEG